jgi:hypothetical protein
MAAFLQYVRSRLNPAAFRHGAAVHVAARVPTAGEAFGRATALSLSWRLESGGQVQSCWQQGRVPLVPPY